MTMRTKPSFLAAAVAAAFALPILCGPMLSASALAQGGMMQGQRGPGMMQGAGPGMMQGGDSDWGPMMAEWAGCRA